MAVQPEVVPRRPWTSSTGAPALRNNASVLARAAPARSGICAVAGLRTDEVVRDRDARARRIILPAASATREGALPLMSFISHLRRANVCFDLVFRQHHRRRRRCRQRQRSTCLPVRQVVRYLLAASRLAETGGAVVFFSRLTPRRRGHGRVEVSPIPSGRPASNLSRSEY